MGPSIDDRADPITATDPIDPGLDERLRAWFQALVDAPVPEGLIRHMEALADGETREPSTAG